MVASKSAMNPSCAPWKAWLPGAGASHPPDEVVPPTARRPSCRRSRAAIWSLPPLPHCPDLLLLATELAGIGGPDLPLEVSAVDSFQSVTDPSERTLTVVARVPVSLSQVYMGEEMLCDALERCLEVSRFLLDGAPSWMDGEV